jgi:hypothetical protein
MQIAKEVYTWTGYLDVEQNLEKFERS